VRRGAQTAVALGIGLGLAAPRAEAFVQSKTADMMHGFFWKTSCVPVTIYLNEFPQKAGMTADQVVKSVTEAAHAWSGDAVTCANGTSPYLEIVPTLAADSAVPPAAAWDARNAIIFRTELWSKSGKPGHDYPVEALAVTTVTARLDGHIVDADMEVNGVSMQWFNYDPGAIPPISHGADNELFDLQNALTHEFGHFIGLDHTCFIPSSPGSPVSADGKLRPKDDLGNDVPDCGAASPASVQTSVMYNVTSQGETSKRFLSSDDIRAVCTIYASTLEHEACSMDSANPGCAVAAVPLSPPARRSWPLGLGAGGFAAVALLFSFIRRR
jgi:hypothetical protein